MSVSIELPFPPASLSGHNKGHWHAKSGVVSKHRDRACEATKAAGAVVPEKGDISVTAVFYPPDRRGDRLNFPVRMKALWDGIADGLSANCGFRVNDSRFVPAYFFGPPEKPGKVVVVIG